MKQKIDLTTKFKLVTSVKLHYKVSNNIYDYLGSSISFTVSFHGS